MDNDEYKNINEQENNFNGENNQEDNGDDSSYENINNNNTSNSNSSNYYFCGDIPGGFQNINPEIFNIIAEILADVVSGRMPFNVQNAIGNWIQLVGQAIETYNAQQEYFQSGPGRYYDLRYYNVDNPFCPNNGQSSNNSNSSNSESENSQESCSESHMTELKKVVNQLKSEIESINLRLEKVEKNKSNHI